MHFMFNFIKGDTSEVFSDMFMYNSQSHLLHIVHVSLKQRTRTLIYEGPVVWNKIQNAVNINCS